MLADVEDVRTFSLVGENFGEIEEAAEALRSALAVNDTKSLERIRAINELQVTSLQRPPSPPRLAA